METIGNWWAIVLRGVAAVVFGLLTLFMPGATLVALVALFGAFALVTGIFALVGGIKAATRRQSWGEMVLVGLTGIAAGLITLFWPGITAMSLLFVIAAWAIVSGIFEIVAAVSLRKVIRGEWALILSGLLGIVFGGLLLASPATGALAVIWLIGAYALAMGVLQIVVGFRLRSVLRHTLPHGRHATV